MSRNKPKSKVRTAKGRKIGSTLWLKRQLNDPYVEEAKKKGYRSRAAFKIIEIDEKVGLFKKGARIVDLGAAPGGWCQIALDKSCDKLVAIDLLDVDPMPGMDFLKMDFMDDDAPDRLKEMLEGNADVVMSDMAPNTTGHKQTDHLRIMAVVEAAFYFACEILEPGGMFVAKVFQGGAQNTTLAEMKKHFKTVKHIKPKSSRSDSSEQYVVATGFQGRS